jgi:hypothetical protein
MSVRPRSPSPQTSFGRAAASGSENANGPGSRGHRSTATGIRTRVSAMRGRRPSPLDDSGANRSAPRLAKPARLVPLGARARRNGQPAPTWTGRTSPLRYLRIARGCGGIGRRARFRSVSGQPGGGSSPLIRTGSCDSAGRVGWDDRVASEPVGTRRRHTTVTPRVPPPATPRRDREGENATLPPLGVTYGRASRIRLNGVSVARRTRVNPPCSRTSVSRASPACAPSARPTSWESDAGVQITVEAP